MYLFTSFIIVRERSHPKSLNLQFQNLFQVFDEFDQS